MKSSDVKTKAAQVISKAANTKAQTTAKVTETKTKSRISKSLTAETLPKEVDVVVESKLVEEVKTKASVKEVIAEIETITDEIITDVNEMINTANEVIAVNEVVEIKETPAEVKIEVKATVPEVEIKVKPVIVIDTVKVTEITDVLFNNSKPLTTLELAKELRKLVNLGMNAVQVASTAKKSYAYTRKLLTLTTATEKTLKLVEDSKVSAWKVVEALLVVGNTPEIVEGIIDRVIADPTTKPVRVKSESDFTKTEVEAMLKDQLNNIVAMLVNGDTVDDISNYKYVLTK